MTARPPGTRQSASLASSCSGTRISQPRRRERSSVTYSCRPFRKRSLNLVPWPDCAVRSSNACDAARRVRSGPSALHRDVIAHAATVGWDPGAAVPGGQRAADRGELRGVPVLRAATFQRGGLPRLVLPVTVDNACGGPEPWGISWITAMFLHGGWDHILGNMGVPGHLRQECRGCLRAAALPGLLLRWRVRGDADTDRDDPAVQHGRRGAGAGAGASGAIAAVLGAYFLLYPRSRVLTYIFPVFFVHIPAWVFLGLWFLYQLIEGNFGLFSASANGGGVAFFAHIGGFLFGLGATWLLARARQVTPARGPVPDE